jgi:hypothetical protein
MHSTSDSTCSDHAAGSCALRLSARRRGAHEGQVFEIVRVSYLLAKSPAVVFERGCRSHEERGLESGIAFAEYDELVDSCVELLDERARRELAERGYQVFSARSQAAMLRRALW